MKIKLTALALLTVIVLVTIWPRPEPNAITTINPTPTNVKLVSISPENSQEEVKSVDAIAQDAVVENDVFSTTTDLTIEQIFNDSNANEIEVAVESLSSWYNPEEIFLAQQALLELKAEQSNSVEQAIMDALYSDQLDAQVVMETIEIVGIESTVHKGALLDWLMQLTDDTEKLALVGVFDEVIFDDNQQMQIAGVIEVWQQSSDEELRSSIAAVAVDMNSVDQYVIASALQDESAQVRYTVLSSLQRSGKQLKSLAPLIKAISDDESQPSEIRRISTQLL